LAEHWGAGIILALGGKGMVDGNHPLVMGGVGTGGSDAAHRALKECDTLLVAGSTWWPPKYMPANATVVQIDRCVANIGEWMPGTFGLAGDCRQVLPTLVYDLRTRPGIDRSEWVDRLTGWKQAWQKVVDQEAGIPNPEGAIPPAVLVRAVQGVAPPGSVITLDTGDHLLWFNRHFAGGGHRVLFSGTWRSMGFALPAAAAAKLCDPGARVIACVGDGGLTMLMGELAVPVQQNLDLTVVVFRNGMLALEAFKAESEGFRPFGHELNNPDFAAVARAFGWKAWQVNSPADLEGALQAAVAHAGPALVDVWTAADGSLHKT
ncbi:MAG TPA: thiamine pyrophosphate-dependent enzyme, partial [Symbiobacteriaceae bacterium]|nr:thiamine pyrophosphate-dependent enzyme [Symbiobacteriaceae bacterium]